MLCKNKIKGRELQKMQKLKLLTPKRVMHKQAASSYHCNIRVSVCIDWWSTFETRNSLGPQPFSIFLQQTGRGTKNVMYRLSPELVTICPS